jgi:hypothetical protein
MTRSNRLSEFVRSLGRYGTPRPGEVLYTEHGRARVLRVLPYEEVVEEMKRDGVSLDGIDGFDARVEHFLGDGRRYFECELAYPDGDVDRIDWSEYLAVKNKRKG